MYVFSDVQCLLAKRRDTPRPADANVYAEIRKSTLEPEPDNSSRQNDGVSNGRVATRAGNQLNALKAEDKHDSLQDLTLIENFMYNTAAECSKPAVDRDPPGACSWTTCLSAESFYWFTSAKEIRNVFDDSYSLGLDFGQFSLLYPRIKCILYAWHFT